MQFFRSSGGTSGAVCTTGRVADCLVGGPRGLGEGHDQSSLSPLYAKPSQLNTCLGRCVYARVEAFALQIDSAKLSFLQSPLLWISVSFLSYIFLAIHSMTLEGRYTLSKGFKNGGDWGELLIVLWYCRRFKWSLPDCGNEKDLVFAFLYNLHVLILYEVETNIVIVCFWFSFSYIMWTIPSGSSLPAILILFTASLRGPRLRSGYCITRSQQSEAGGVVRSWLRVGKRLFLSCSIAAAPSRGARSLHSE